MKSNMPVIFKIFFMAFLNAVRAVAWLLAVAGFSALLIWLVYAALNKTGLEVKAHWFLAAYPFAMLGAMLLLLLLTEPKYKKAVRLIEKGRYKEARKILEAEQCKTVRSGQAAKLLADLCFRGLGGDAEPARAVQFYDEALFMDTLGLLKVFKAGKKPVFKPSGISDINECLDNLSTLAQSGLPEAWLALGFWCYSSPRAWDEREKAAGYFRRALEMGHFEVLPVLKKILSVEPEMDAHMRESLSNLLAEYDSKN